MSWGSAVDIWNLGALVSGAWSVSPIVHFSDKSQVWDLFERQHLFGDIFDQNGNHDPFKHLALMVALIGPPQADFVQRSETTGQCFDYNGKRHQIYIQSFNRILILVLTFLQVIGLLVKMRSCPRPPWKFWRKGFVAVKRNIFFIFLGRCRIGCQKSAGLPGSCFRIRGCSDPSKHYFDNCPLKSKSDNPWTRQQSKLSFIATRFVHID